MSRAIKLSKQLSSPCLTSDMGFFRGSEDPQDFMLPAVLDVRDVTSGISLKRNAFKPAGVVAPDALVHQILGTGSESQIGPTVVGAVAITVINLFGRPLTSHDEPNQAVSIIIAVVDPEADVPVQPPPSRWLTDYRPTREGLFPSQNARLGIVVEDAADVLRREVVASAFVSHRGSIHGV